MKCDAICMSAPTNVLECIIVLVAVLIFSLSAHWQQYPPTYLQDPFRTTLKIPTGIIID